MAYEKIREKDVPTLARRALELSAELRAPHEEVPDLSEVYAALSFSGSANGGWTRVGLVPIKDESEALYIGDGQAVSVDKLLAAIQRKARASQPEGILCRQIRLEGAKRAFPELVFVQNTAMLKGERTTMLLVSFVRSVIDPTKTATVRTESGVELGVMVADCQFEGFRNSATT